MTLFLYIFCQEDLFCASMKGIMTCKTPYLVEKFKNVDGSDFSAFGLVTIFREKSINLEKEKKKFQVQLSRYCEEYHSAPISLMK